MTSLSLLAGRTVSQSSFVYSLLGNFRFLFFSSPRKGNKMHALCPAIDTMFCNYWLLTPSFWLHTFVEHFLNQTNTNTNTKSLFRNGGHRPIIQNSHNTILTMSGKLEIIYLSYLIRLGKILFKLVSWKSVFMVLTHNKSSTRVAR